MGKLSLFAALFAIVAIIGCSCKQIQYVPVETVKTEYRDKIVRDSVLRYDSVFVKEKGDTVFYERYKYLYRDKIVMDSIFKCDTIRVPYPVEVVNEVKAPLTGWQNFQVWCGRALLLLALIAAVYLGLKLKKIFP